MKMIIAVFRPEKLQAVKDKLKETGISGMTITDVRGRGQQSGLVFSNRVGTITVDEIEKVKIEVVTEDSKEEAAIGAIMAAARTGHEGDGRIFVLPVEKSIRIREPKPDPIPEKASAADAAGSDAPGC